MGNDLRWLSVLLFAVGCAGSVQVLGGRPAPPPDTALYPGDAGGEPSMESLPALDVPRSALTRRMKLAWMLSEESFGVPKPGLPSDRSAASLQAWSERVLSNWMERKNERVEAARAELNKAALENERQRIMAGAMLGLVYEDVALVLMRLPVPDELRGEPEIAQMYREVLQGQAKPYVENARSAYAACAVNARRGVSTMRHWSSFCRSRADGLPTDEPPPEGTTVEVIRE